MFPEKFEAWAKEAKEKEFKRQHPTDDVAKGTAKILPREFGEIATQKDFEEKCTSRKACALAFLPALTSVSIA